MDKADWGVAITATCSSVKTAGICALNAIRQERDNHYKATQTKKARRCRAGLVDQICLNRPEKAQGTSRATRSVSKACSTMRGHQCTNCADIAQYG